MSRLRSVFGFLCLCGVTLATCPNGWVKLNDLCYKLNNDPNADSFDEQLASCRHQGGSLASIHNAQQQAFIEDLASQAAPQPVWIGLYDEYKNGSWAWADGSPVDYTNWGPSQPLNADGSEFCTQLQTDSNGTWAEDKCCGNSTVGICQKPDPDTCQCQRNWSYFPQQNSCYLVVTNLTNPFNFTVANTTCHSLGSEVVSIHSLAENFYAMGLTLVQNPTGGGAWIGFYRNALNTPFYWTDSSVVNYTQWHAATGEPRQDGLCTGGLSTGWNGDWNDVSCAATIPSVVCKRKASS